MLKKLIRLNLDDLLLWLAVEGGLFLVIQIIIGCVMRFGRPETSVTISCVLFPIVGGVLGVIAGSVHIVFSFDLALRFGQTRRRALGLALGVISFETAFAMALGGALAALERLLAPTLWARLAERDGWAMGNLMPIPEDMLVNGVPVSKKILLIEEFTLDWCWWPLIFGASIVIGVIVGALLYRFGSKGGWVIWGICVAPMLLSQLLPKGILTAGWLIPLLTVLLLAAFLWSVWYLLHAVVRQ